MSTPLNGSILKGFDILRLITVERPELTAATAQAELGMNFATAHRLLATLEEAGALLAVRRGVYRLGLETVQMGKVAEATTPYLARVQPLIDALCARLHESVMICRFTHAGPVCAAVAPAGRPITVSIRVGTCLGFATSAQGRLWLAEMQPGERAALIDGAGEAARAQGKALDRAGLERELAAIRARGHALNNGDAEPDIAAVAAPIRDAGGRILLTISAFGPLSRFGPGFVDEAAREVVRVAREIEAALRR